MSLKHLRLGAIIALLLMVACAAIGPNAAYAQVGVGAAATLTGRVTDPSGAVVPGALVTLVNNAGGLPRSTTSNDSGYYTFSLLAPGSYRLTVTKAGFGDVVIPSVMLQVNQTANVNATMRPGKLVQQVSVSAATTGLQTQTSSLGAVVGNRMEEQLPLTFRDPSQLVNLVSGVTSDHRASGTGAGLADSNGLSYQGRLDFSMNGGIRDQVSAMVDGVDVTIDGGSFLSVPIITTPDNTQEFKAQTNNYSAQFGRGAGVINIVTKSGTNNLHGSVYEFLQNNALDANDLFSNRAGESIPHTERNQYGFAVGGPLWIPKVYDGRNKTFWFMDLERLSQTRFLPLSLRVPTAAERAGDFSNDFSTSGTPITVYNPFDTYVDPNTGQTLRHPFLGNKIPSGMLNSFGGSIMNYFPMPNNAGFLAPGGLNTGIGNYFVSGAAPLDFNRYDIKVDENVSNAHRLMWRYSHSLYHTIPVNYFGNVAYSQSVTTRDNYQNGYNMVLSWTWTPSPTVVVTQAGNWSRLIDDSNQPAFNVSSLGGPFANGAVESYANAHAGGAAFPNISIGGFAAMGNGFGNNFKEPYSNYVYEFGIVKTHGKHTLGAGFQYALLQAADNLFKRFGGAYNFGGGFSCGPNPLNCSANTGNPLSDFELGLFSSDEMDAAFSSLYTSNYAAWYVQDDFRVTPKLTVNLGLRYDFTTPYTERFDHEFRFNPTRVNPLGDALGPNTSGQTLDQYFANLSGRPLTGAVEFPSSPGVSGRGMVPTDFRNLAPRLGFAYSPRNSWVVRGGFAKLYMPSPAAPGPSTPGNGPFGATTTTPGTIDGINPFTTINNPFPAGFNLPTYDSQGLLSLVGNRVWAGSTGQVTPYQYQWNIGVQHQLPSDSIISVAYAGETAHRLTCPFFACGDQIPMSLVQQNGAKVFSSVPNPFYGIITNPTLALSTPTVQLGQLLKQWPEYTGWVPVLPPWQGPNPNHDTFGNAWNALEVQFTKHLSHGLSIMAAYTWSKNLTNADSFEGGYLGPQVGYQNTYNYQGEWSLSAEDVPQRLVIGHVYDLPIGHGERFGSHMPSVLDKALGHWQFSGITTFQSGFPLPISETAHQTGAFGGGDRPNVIGNPCMSGLSRGQRIIQGTLNPSAFQTPPEFSFGNAPRLLGCLGDPIKNFDWSLVKFIPITERFNAEFRAEFFNIFNRPQLANPNTTFNSSSFGLITSQLNSPRVIQFGLKLNF